MSDQQAAQAAQKYMEKQAEIMKKYGESPKLSGKRYESAIKATTRTFQTISTKVK
ncbi:MAG TPA: hypothetical protein VFW25_12770 [Silvibacterium sp.]|nr:hypothetical protein [Silvibacterium sp.]